MTDIGPNECMWCLEPLAPGEYRFNYGIDLDTTVIAHVECHQIAGPPPNPLLTPNWMPNWERP